jgi:hypothetical protein
LGSMTFINTDLTTGYSLILEICCPLRAPWIVFDKAYFITVGILDNKGKKNVQH